MTTRRLSTVVVAGLAAALLTACGSTAEKDPEPKEKLTIFAASSLKGAFEEMEKEFESDHNVDITFSFGGSSDLGAQILDGAPVDVFASADENNMDKVAAEVVDPELFATNTLMIVVPPDNPGEVDSLDDLTNPDLKIVVCAPEVPCGAATTKVEQDAGIDIAADSEESTVTDVLGKVQSGEADAGLVYVTDVKGAGDSVVGIDFDGSDAVVNRYPIAVVDGASDLAAEFIAFVLSDEGQQILAEYGFGKP